VRSIRFLLLALVALAIFTVVAWAEEKTNLRDVLDMEDDLDLELIDVAKSYRKIKLFLRKPDPRMSSLLAKFIANSKALSQKQRDTLFAAAMMVADARAFGYLRETLSDTEFLRSLDVDIIEKLVILTGRTAHPDAAKVLRQLYEDSLLIDTRIAALYALGECNARAEMKFILLIVADEGTDTHLRGAAIITSVRLGNGRNIPAFIALAIDLAGGIDKITSNLSYLAGADKREYAKAVKQLGFLRRNVKHIPAAMRVACTEHAAVVFDRFIQADEIGELELYCRNLDVLVDSLPVALAIQTARHPSVVVGPGALEALAKRLGAKSAEFAGVLESLMKSNEPSLRARVFEIVGMLAEQRKEDLIRQGLKDSNYLCREAAVRSAIALPVEARTRLLTVYVREEPFERLRASALWMLRNPAAKSVLP